MKAHEVYETIRRHKIIVIVRGVGGAKIIDIANALYAGGIRLMEVTCNTPGATQMIQKLAKEMTGKMIIGAGTVITKDLCEQVIKAGAEYIVAPDVNPEVIDYAIAHDVAVLPGAATATEILTAVRAGAQMVKIFPAAALGTDYIRQLRGPIDNVDFVAVGGVRLDNIDEFISAGCVAFGIGGAVISPESVENCRWEQMTQAARSYKEKLAEATAGK
ncbi:MAG TPA: bifunctional 4-hydroxy-2-oxoglutarate aldolase/2-dehydro-3-deoxy-phosphogluconate aldolase [Planctomycetes bacterium]|nr:bifunctional 4-hydroxy-2-oxoglutarate aldolase/2-dehydro-3-deoxy-phosphogluconate aldolase [Planctomycetota bacterium]